VSLVQGCNRFVEIVENVQELVSGQLGIGEVHADIVAHFRLKCKRMPWKKFGMLFGFDAVITPWKQRTCDGAGPRPFITPYFTRGYVETRRKSYAVA